MSEELEFDPRAKLIQALRNAHNAHGRTQQVEIGPSSIGDCRRKVWHKIQQTPETNQETKIWAAMMGRFIHDGIQRIMAEEDSPFPESKQFELEQEVHYKEMPGHIDFYHKGVAYVIDWKTTLKKNLKNFPSQQNIWQVQNYGLMKASEGAPVRKVCLVVLPRDGNEDDFAQWIGDYDEEEALKGQAWLEEVRQREKAPNPERNAKQYCFRYCEYFDPSAKIGCPGGTMNWMGE